MELFRPAILALYAFFCGVPLVMAGPAQAAPPAHSPDEVFDLLGQAEAVAALCPALEVHRTGIRRVIREAGLTSHDLRPGSPGFDASNASQRLATDLYQRHPEARRCAVALALFGPAGSLHPGLVRPIDDVGALNADGTARLFRLVTNQTLHNSPDEVIGQRLEMRDMGCWTPDNRSFSCAADGEFYITIEADDVRPEPARSRLETHCESWSDRSKPECRFTIRFIPTDHENLSRTGRLRILEFRAVRIELLPEPASR